MNNHINEPTLSMKDLFAVFRCKRISNFVNEYNCCNSTANSNSCIDSSWARIQIDYKSHTIFMHMIEQFSWIYRDYIQQITIYILLQ